MTLDAAALLCCCTSEIDCCPLTAVTMTIPTLSLSFDFEFVSPVDGLTYRRFTAGSLGAGNIWQPGPLGLTASLLQPIILPRRGPNTQDASFGTIGRCGYRQSKNVTSGPYTGWTGTVVTVPAGVPPTLQDSTTWSGNAIPQGQTSGTVWYYIRPFRMNGWNQSDAPWAFEAGIVCGQISAGVIASWPSSGCPIGLSWGSGNLAGGFTYYRGKVRFGGSSFGSLSALTEPTWTEQQVAQFAASYAPSSFAVNIA